MTKPTADQMTIDALRSVLKQISGNARACLGHGAGAERQVLMEIIDVAQRCLQATEPSGTVPTTPDSPAARPASL